MTCGMRKLLQVRVGPDQGLLAAAHFVLTLARPQGRTYRALDGFGAHRPFDKRKVPKHFELVRPTLALRRGSAAGGEHYDSHLGPRSLGIQPAHPTLAMPPATP